MVNITIDGKQISVSENTTIMEAAKANGIPIPKLCYLKGINEIAACRVCVVELEGKEKLITSCNNVAEEGMVIYTNSPKVRKHRRTTVELILSQHDCQCVTCPRSGNCSLQKISNDLNILEIPFKQELERQKGVLCGFVLIVLGIASSALSRTTGGTDVQNFISGVLMGLSVAEILAGIWVAGKTFLKK